MKTSNMKINLTKSPYWAMLAIYLLIVFEFFYMASPFALYFYSVYKPGLNFLDNLPALAWTTGFFLPHLAEATTSPLFNSIKMIGAIFACIGFLVFIICALQVYYTKLFKKTVVTGGIYKIIRHPQYSAFSVCSFGLLLLWPRYLSLIMFVAVLFVYYFLAKAEEKECERKFGEAYLNYKNKTFMFLPYFKSNFNLIGNLRLSYKIVVVLAMYIVFLTCSVKFADFIKKQSIRFLYSQYKENVTYLSIYEIDNKKFQEIITLVNNSKEISSLTATSNNLIAYILPAELYISEIPMIKPVNATCHVFNGDYNFKNYKVIFTEAQPKAEQYRNNSDILYKSLSLKPLLELWVDMSQLSIIKSIILTEKDIRYKNIAEPIF